jgi:hypothetical protein
MWDTLGYYLHVFAWSTLPWWLYFGAAVALAIFIVVVFKSRIAWALAVIVLVAGTAVGAYAYGSSTMHEADQREVQRQVDAEKARLNAAFQVNTQAEVDRALKAQQESDTLQGEVNDTLSEANSLPDPQGNPVGVDGHPDRCALVLPAGVARRVRAIGSHSGLPTRPAPSPRGAR